MGLDDRFLLCNNAEAYFPFLHFCCKRWSLLWLRFCFCTFCYFSTSFFFFVHPLCPRLGQPNTLHCPARLMALYLSHPSWRAHAQHAAIRRPGGLLQDGASVVTSCNTYLVVLPTSSPLSTKRLFACKISIVFFFSRPHCGPTVRKSTQKIRRWHTLCYRRP